MSQCSAIIPLLEPFVDGELSPERMVEIELHISLCPGCMERVRWDHALQVSVRRVAHEAAPATARFEKRVRLALAAERAREAEAIRGPAPGTLLPWRTILPVMAAAAATLVWAATVGETTQPQYAAPPRAVQAGIADGGESLLQEFVRYHTSAPEGTSSNLAADTLVKSFEPELGEPVRAPSLREYGARWEGGAVIPVRNQRAALMRYRIGNQRITVYLYDSSKHHLRDNLVRRVVRDRPVYVGRRQGYSIAAAERDRIGVAAAADLDDDETAELVAAAFP